VCPTVFLIYFISAAVILLASLAFMVQFSLPYNRAGRARVTPDFSSYSTDSLDVYLFTSVCSLITLLLLLLVLYLTVKNVPLRYSKFLSFSFCSPVASKKGCTLLYFPFYISFESSIFHNFICYIYTLQYTQPLKTYISHIFYFSAYAICRLSEQGMNPICSSME